MNSDEGVFYAELKALENIDSYKLLSISQNSLTDRCISLGFKGNKIAFSFVDNISDNVEEYDVDVFTYNKAVIKYDSQYVKFFLNGDLVHTETKQLEINFITITSYFDGSIDFFGRVKDLQVYTTALTDEQLTQLTTI